jgi:putative Holliday junction resolvase
MAIDYGTRRVGIALTDPLCLISQPLVTLTVTSHHELIKRLKFIIEERNVGLVLVGNPLSHRGTATTMSHEIHRFVEKLRKALGIEVKLWDERFTSAYAAVTMKERGISKSKKSLDQVAACIMLDEYLKSHSS